MSEHLSPQRARSGELKVIAAIAFAILQLLTSFNSAASINFYSDQTYSFNVPPPPPDMIYTYQWIASDGYWTDNRDRIFNWTAPFVDIPKNVTINATITDRICTGSNEIEITVYPKPFGQISLEKLFEGDPDNVKLGDTITYILNISNTGQTSVVYLPLVDDYPEEFLLPVSSDRTWDQDNGSALIWNNLVDIPLAPGESVKVSVSLRVIAAPNPAAFPPSMIINVARVEGAKDDSGAELEPKEADFIIAGVLYECPMLGPEAACFGEEVAFSALPGLQSYSWVAKDSEGNSVGGFNDSTKPTVKWTSPGPGTYEISFNNLMCTQSITVSGCGKINLEKLFEGDPDNVKLGDTITYILNISNTGQTSVVYLPLVDDYPEEFLLPVSSDRTWDQDDGSALIWNNLADSPLAPGESLKVSLSLRVIAAPDPAAFPLSMIINVARVSGAKDDSGAELEPKEADFIIAGVLYECPMLGPEAACFGEEVTFSALPGLESYSWEAKDAEGNSVGGFNDSTKPTVKWTSPGPGTYEISFNNLMCTQMITIDQCNSSIRIDKNCSHRSAYVGDKVTYFYNITNTGELSLKDVIVSDAPDWGPPCTPAYIGGDEGDNILSPSETWRYECQYTIPDPADYQLLAVMSDQLSTAKKEKQIQKLMNGRSRLEIMTDKLKMLRDSFDKSLAKIVISQISLGGINCTRFNYTKKASRESLEESIDTQGIIRSSLYFDPISDSTLSSMYSDKGEPIIYTYDSRSTRESLRIEYDKPSKGYLTYTIIDHTTGDSLILMVLLSNGTAMKKEYRKTPGYQEYENRVWLKNVATVTAEEMSSNMVSDVDAYQLEILRPQPILSLVKTASSDLVPAGQILTYALNYKNLGYATAHGVVLKENYDHEVAFVSSSPMPDVGTDDTWSLGDLAVGGSGTIMVNVKVNPLASNGTLIENVAEMSCLENITANTSANATVLGGGVSLEINKTASTDFICPGERFTYSINYMNIGVTNATNITIDEIIDSNLDLEPPIEFNPPIDSAPEYVLPQHYRWTIKFLRPGEGGQIKLNVKAKDSIPQSVKRIYNLYKISSNESQGVYKSLETLVVHSLFVRKTAQKNYYSPGEQVKYTILYGNEGDEGTAEDVIIKDYLPDVEFVEASITPKIQGRILIWDSGNLPELRSLSPQESGLIYLTVKIKERPQIKFSESQSIFGEGYISERKMLSTNQEPYSLTNYVEITSATPAYRPESDSSTISVGDPGTEIKTVEHGSGYYEQEQLASLNNSNKSTRLDKHIFAKYSPTVFALPKNREISFNSQWFDRTNAKNYLRDEKVSESHLYMDLIKKDSSFLVDPNQSVYKSEGEFFGGKTQIEYKKNLPNSTKSEVEISEVYHGSFKTGYNLDSYGSGIMYSKSSEGQGFVASDKKIGYYQRSFESGSGHYRSDELIQAGTVRKDSSMTYNPNMQAAGSMNINYSSLWHEEMGTSDRSIGATISERITSAKEIKKETVMVDATMALLGEFEGTGEIKAVQKNSSKGKENLRVEQTFSGKYKLDTSIGIHQAPKYIRPHINVTKKALKLDENAVLFRINITNDGNKTLGPVQVIDQLPDGLTFINSSLRPTVDGNKISWSILSLQIGGKQSITILAGINETASRFTNIVNVSAYYSGGSVGAEASCSFVLDWLPCCLIEADISKDNRSISVKDSKPILGGWSPPKCMNLELNLSECSFDRTGECNSCSLAIPENG